MSATLKLLLAATALPTLLTAANVRIDLNGISNGIVLQPGESGGFSVRRAGWEEKEKQIETAHQEYLAKKAESERAESERQAARGEDKGSKLDLSQLAGDE